MSAGADADDRDAWLDDVRRWYYGGTPPASERDPDHHRDREPEPPGRRDEPDRRSGRPAAHPRVAAATTHTGRRPCG